MIKLKYFVAGLLLTMVLLTSGCGSKDKLPPEIKAMMNSKDGSVLKLGVYGDPWNLNPLLSLSENGRLVCNFIHAAPVKKASNGSFAPYLFDSWYFTRGASGTIIMDAVWKRNLKWSDGTVFDPNDLKFTIDQMKKVENGSPYQKLAEGILSINSFGQGLRTRIVFASDSRRYLDLLTIGIIPSHIFKEQKLNKAKISENASDTVLYSDKPISLGVYKVTNRKKGYYMVLEPTGLIGTNASSSKILVKSYFRVESLLGDFRNDKLDWINLPSEFMAQVKQLGMANSLFTKYPNPAYLVWLFNNKKAPFDKSEVRNALNLIANRDKVKKQIPFEGQAMYCSPLSANCPELNTKYDERVQKAKSLLDSVGIIDSDSDGYRDWQGKRFKVTICFNQDNLIRKMVGASLIEDLKSIGIEGALKPVSWAELLNDKLEKSNFETCLVSYQLNEYGNWTNVFASEHKLGENLNFAGFSNAKVDAALAAIDSLVSFSESKKMEQRKLMSEEINRECPLSFLYEPFDVGVVHSEQGRSIASNTIWDDVLSWKIMGAQDSNSNKK